MSYPLYYPVRPAPLKNFALTRMAIDLLSYRHPSSVRLRAKYKNDHDLGFSCDEILQRVLPSSITEMINERICSVLNEFLHLLDVFISFCIIDSGDNSTQIPAPFIRLIDCLMYGPDGEICFERSARKMMMSRDLNPLQKYKIACVYWLENDIRQIWPSVSDDLGRISPGDVLEQIFQFWAAKMTQDGHVSIPDVSEMVCFAEYFRNWTAFEYVLNTLSVEKQCALIVCGISNNPIWKYIMSKFNTVRANYVMQKYGGIIMRNAALEDGCIEYALKIWNSFRETICEKFFNGLLNDLFRKAYTCGKRGKICYKISAAVGTILLEIWTTVSNQMKMEFYSCFDNLSVGYWLQGLDPPVCYDHDMSFLSLLFREMPQEIRTRIWYRRWHLLVTLSGYELLKKLLKWCLRDENEIKEFVEKEMLNVTKLRSIVNSWLRQKLYYEVIEYSNLCWWNTNLVREFRRKIFSSVSLMKVKMTVNGLNNLAKDIDARISNVDDSREAKKAVFFSNEVQEYLLLNFKRCELDKIFALVECLLPTEREKLEKYVVLGHWRKFLISEPNAKNDLGRLHEFLSWAKGDENGWPRFKQFIDVGLDDIFNDLLLDAVQDMAVFLGPMDMKRSEPEPMSSRELGDFFFIQFFLKWHFGNEEAVKKYKRRKILNYKEMIDLDRLLRIDNECIVNDVLRWFFDDDFIEIRTFKNGLE